MNALRDRIGRTDPPSLALVLGSDREGRLGEPVVRWLCGLIAAGGWFRVDPVDPLTLDLPARMTRTPDPAVLDLRERIGRADAMMFVTPEYNHGYPAALKRIIDHVVGEWAIKPVALVGYGGISGGLLAMAQLRQVMAALDAVTIRESLSLPMIDQYLDPSWRFIATPAITQAAQRMLVRLAWWADSLGRARARMPPLTCGERPLRHEDTHHTRIPLASPCSDSSKT